MNKILVTVAAPILVGCVLCLDSPIARADWVIVGAQYSCARQTNEFSLIPSDQTSGYAPGTTPQAKGFTQLANGITDIQCSLGRYAVQAQVGVSPPSATGECEAGGWVSLFSLSVNGVEFIPHRTDFGMVGCPTGESSIQSVNIRVIKHGIRLTKCESPPSSPTNPIPPAQCHTADVNVTAVAAANAKVDISVADQKVQQAQSATKLPWGNDLAPFFGTYPEKSKIPLCAHWSSLFIKADAKERHGRIAGIVGERVPVYTRNPQLCPSVKGERCTTQADLSAGTRVEIGLICGAWTYIQFIPRVRSEPAIHGWVETARLYSVDPLLVSISRSGKVMPSFVGQTVPTLRHAPLLNATWNGDIATVKRLISSGDNVNGVGHDEAPLSVAASNGNVAMVSTLLALGASATIGDRLDTCSAPLLFAAAAGSAKVVALLLKAGANPSCRTVSWQLDSLMLVARIRRPQYMQSLQSGTARLPVPDPVSIARLLLAAGLDPNLRSLDGSTALFDTAESNNVDVAAFLLRHGANPNISRNDYNTEEAIGTGDYHGSTPLMEAMWWYPLRLDPTLFQLLLDNGADPNYRNPAAYDDKRGRGMNYGASFAGQTALTKAAEMGYYTLVQLLLEHGANPNIPRSDGARAVDIARLNGHDRIAELIERYSGESKSQRAVPPHK